eukprot:m.9842 g.9842  ORF g.9842 m.9842 type:complete len:227 (-) comp5498_c0_seq1:1961-2641(-)
MSTLKSGFARKPSSKRKSSKSKSIPTTPITKKSKPLKPGNDRSVFNGADSWYGEGFEVEEILSAQTVKTLKFKVRWEGDWPPDQKETWEDKEHISAELVQEYIAKHGYPADTTSSSSTAVPLEQLKRETTEQASAAATQLRNLLEYLEPPTWKDVAGKQISQFTDAELADVSVDIFLDNYQDCLQKQLLTIARKRSRAKAKQKQSSQLATQKDTDMPVTDASTPAP